LLCQPKFTISSLDLICDFLVYCSVYAIPASRMTLNSAQQWVGE
jgi:hypothetical protein